MKIHGRILSVMVLLGLVFSFLLAPSSHVSALGSTNFQEGDTFTFKMNKFDLMVALNGTNKIDSSNYTFVSIDEPMDVTIENITLLNPITSESNVSASIDFHNTNIVDSSNQFYINTLTWDEQIQFGVFLSAVLVGNFDPNFTDFNDTVINQDMFFSDPTSQPENGSLLFPSLGGKMMPFFVDINETYVNSLYEEYLINWIELNASGTPQDGYSDRISEEFPVGINDQINITQRISELILWDNQTKIFDLAYGFEILHFGTYNNGLEFNSHSNFTIQLKIDFNRGVVLFFDQDLEIQYSIPEASYYLLYNFGFYESSQEPQVSETQNSRSLVVSSPTTLISRSNTTDSDISNTMTDIEDTTDNPTVNFLQTGTALFGFVILQIFYRKNRK